MSRSVIEITLEKQRQDERLARENGAERVNYVSDVPCHGCTLCCHHDIITLSEAEAVFFPNEPNPIYPEKRMLAHKQNGDCIYLTDRGCGNYQDRPQVCRAADCRRVASRITQQQAERMGILNTWLKGRELTRRKQK